MGACTTKDAVEHRQMAEGAERPLRKEPTAEEEPQVLKIHGNLSPEIINASAQAVQQRGGALSSGNTSPVGQPLDSGSGSPLPVTGSGTASAPLGTQKKSHFVVLPEGATREEGADSKQEGEARAARWSTALFATRQLLSKSEIFLTGQRDNPELKQEVELLESKYAELYRASEELVHHPPNAKGGEEKEAAVTSLAAEISRLLEVVGQKQQAYLDALRNQVSTLAAENQLLRQQNERRGSDLSAPAKNEAHSAEQVAYQQRLATDGTIFLNEHNHDHSHIHAQHAHDQHAHDQHAHAHDHSHIHAQHAPAHDHSHIHAQHAHGHDHTHDHGHAAAVDPHDQELIVIEPDSTEGSFHDEVLVVDGNRHAASTHRHQHYGSGQPHDDDSGHRQYEVQEEQEGGDQTQEKEQIEEGHHDEHNGVPYTGQLDQDDQDGNDQDDQNDHDHDEQDHDARHGDREDRLRGLSNKVDSLTGSFDSSPPPPPMLPSPPPAVPVPPGSGYSQDEVQRLQQEKLEAERKASLLEAQLASLQSRPGGAPGSGPSAGEHALLQKLDTITKQAQDGH